MYILLCHYNLGHKGHIEVFEETGIDVYIIENFRQVITYLPKKNVVKDVAFFLR